MYVGLTLDRAALARRLAARAASMVDGGLARRGQGAAQPGLRSLPCRRCRGSATGSSSRWRSGGSTPQRARAHAAGHGALRQAAGDVVRAGAGRRVDRRGRGAAAPRPWRRRSRRELDQGGPYRVSRPRDERAGNGHATGYGPTGSGAGGHRGGAAAAAAAVGGRGVAGGAGRPGGRGRRHRRASRDPGARDPRHPALYFGRGKVEEVASARARPGRQSLHLRRSALADPGAQPLARRSASR